MIPRTNPQNRSASCPDVSCNVLERLISVFFVGACASVTDSEIYLCFSSTIRDEKENDYKKCRYARDPLDKFTEAPSSVYYHKQTSIAASDSKLESYVTNNHTPLFIPPKIPIFTKRVGFRNKTSFILRPYLTANCVQRAAVLVL